MTSRVRSFFEIVANPGPRRLRIPVMKKPAAALAALAALSFLGACSSDDGDSSSSAGTDGSTVTTKLLAYEPQELTVKVGTTVTWTVSDSVAHTVTTGDFKLGGDGLRTSENPDGVIDEEIGSGKDASHTFTEPGTYTYYCSIHKGMTGVVEVTA